MEDCAIGPRDDRWFWHQGLRSTGLVLEVACDLLGPSLMGPIMKWLTRLLTKRMGGPQKAHGPDDCLRRGESRSNTRENRTLPDGHGRVSGWTGARRFLAAFFARDLLCESLLFTRLSSGVREASDFRPRAIAGQRC